MTISPEHCTHHPTCLDLIETVETRRTYAYTRDDGTVVFHAHSEILYDTEEPSTFVCVACNRVDVPLSHVPSFDYT